MKKIEASKVTHVGFFLMIIVLITKVSALLLTLIFSRIYGANQITDAYYAASSLPNLINSSLAVCSLTLFIPIYNECLKKGGKELANKFSSNVLNSYFLFNVILTMVVCVLSPFLASIIAPGFDASSHSYTVKFICLLSLSFPFTIATQVLINVCNANRKHIVQASLTLLNHVLTILLLFFVAKYYSLYLYPIICLLSWIIQLSLQYLYTKKYFVHSISNFFKDKFLKKMLILSIPVIVATSAEQLNLTIDTIICSTLSSGSISFLGYSHKIHIAVLGTFTSVLMTIFYPIISRDYNNDNKKEVYNGIKKYVNILLLLIIPTTLFLVLNGDSIINLLYGNGSIDSSGLKIVSILFIIYSTSLLFASIKELTTKLYYVLNDTKTPMIINIVCVGINVFLSLLLKQYIGVYGIALATSISTLMCAILEGIVLAKRSGGIKGLFAKNIFSFKHYFQIIYSSCLCFTISMIIKNILAFNNTIYEFIIISFVFFSIYIIVLLISKNVYIRDILNSLFNILRRKKNE